METNDVMAARGSASRLQAGRAASGEARMSEGGVLAGIYSVPDLQT